MTGISLTRGRWCLVVVAALVGSLALPPVAEAKTKRKDGQARAFSSCVRGISPYGAYVEIAARNSVVWRNPSHATVDFAFNESKVRDCGPSGGMVKGGELSFRTVVEFSGDQIEKCSVGTSGVGCEINPDRTQATYTFEHGPVKNDQGRGALKVGGLEVNSGNTGHVYSVKFITSTTLTEGADQAQAQATIDLHH